MTLQSQMSIRLSVSKIPKFYQVSQKNCPLGVIIFYLNISKSKFSEGFTQFKFHNFGLDLKV